jgi:hypothetical protein
MKKARLIFLASLVLLAISAFKGNPNETEHGKPLYKQQPPVVVDSPGNR